ncbi:MAG TPA: M1 family aminopeptidase [Rhizomicrobium sp.]|nr:M1 family aminopeptidase [Rhizomicrobium sp.]
MRQAARCAALILIAGLALAGCNPPASKPVASHKGLSLVDGDVPLGKLPRDAVPTHYHIALRIDPKAERFNGHVEIDVKFMKAARSLYIHGLGLNVQGVSVRLKNGQSFAAHYDQVDPSGVARLIFVDKVPAGDATLIFDYDAAYSHSLDGLYKVVDRGDSYAFTQFESTDARRCFPSFDEPGFKTPFDVTVIAPRSLKVIGNTAPVGMTPASAGMEQTVFETTKPLPTYLVALAVGPLDIVDGGWLPANKYRSKPLHIRGVTARGNGPRIAYALSLTPKIVAALEDYFGIAYPFQKLDVLAVPDFAAGAMENAGAITFRERLLLIDPDSSLEQKRGSLSVQAHELAHQWFGDLVTPAWWDDIWLNESFADWMAPKGSQAVLPEQDFTTDTLRGGIEVMNLDELPSARQIHQPIKNVDDLANAFDSITYDKGAAVLRMFEAYVGPAEWQRGIHAYLTKFARGNATAHDFIGTIAATTNHPELVQAFDDFIDRPGVPLLRFQQACALPATLNAGQSMYEPYGFTAAARRWHVPACVVDGGGKICKMSDAGFVLPLKDCNALPLPNAEGAGYYHFAVDEPYWTQLIAGAAKSDPVSQITLLGNVFAALRNGHAKAADALTLVKTLAPVARWDVLRTIDRRLSPLRAALAPSDVAPYRAFLSKAFLARFKTIGVAAKPNEAPADAYTREYLAQILVTEAHDPTATVMLAGPILASNASGADKWKAIPPDTRTEALRATLRTSPGFADDLIGVYQTTNEETLRRDIVYAFAGSEDAGAIGKLLALAPARMRAGEIRYLYENMPEEPVARQALWSYINAHFGDFAKRFSLRGMGSTAVILHAACDADSHAQTEQFYQSRLSEALGAKRRIGHTEDEIDRCVAFKKNASADVTSALASLQ